MKKTIILMAMVAMLVLTFNVTTMAAVAAEEAKKVEKGGLWNKFIQLFSNPLFFCRGECMDFRVSFDSKKGDITESVLARYDLHDDWDVYGQYSSGKTVKNPFQKRLPFCVKVEILKKSEDVNYDTNYLVSSEFFEDMNFDGKVDAYQKSGRDSYRDFSIPVKEFPSDMQKQLQARFDALLEKLVGQMQKELREYLGIQTDKKK